MTIEEMFGQSAILSLVGMGTVFLFLAILIVFVSVVAKLVKAMKWDKDLYEDNAAQGQVSSSAGAKATVVSIIAAAIHEHRNNNRG